MEKFRSMWTLLLLLPCVLAAPTQQNTCPTECRSPLINTKFNYAVGQTYIYNFKANTKTWMLDNSDDQALLEVKGQALVTFRTQCDAVLRLRLLTTTGNNLEDKVDTSELEKRDLSFSWQDGTVDSLCPDQDEPIWVVNIKRSILSMLQHTAQSVRVAQSNVIENDVIGRCPTEYNVERTNDVITVIKAKIPNQCSHRFDSQSFFPISVPYDVSSKSQTIPLMKSTSVCKQDIKDNIIHSVKCHESHRFRPISIKRGGVCTDVESSISLISTTGATTEAISVSSNRVPKSLILDPRGVRSEFKDVNSAVFAMCQELAGDSVHISRLFTELVYSLRKASSNKIISAWNNLRDGKICPETPKIKKLFLDALPQAGSTGSIVAMVEILKEKKLSSRQTLSWYMSLPLSNLVDIDAIKAVLSLVDDVSNSRVALLGITGLVRRYCSKNLQECQSNSDVLEFSTKLSNMLGNNCHVGQESEVQVISVLKSLGNLGVMTSGVLATVSDCAKDASLPTTVRLAAIEASRNTPCTTQVKDNLLNILEDRKEDAEIRIAAYQGIMRCPCSQSLERIQNIFNSEEINQVGSYINSHLINIKSNQTPSKKFIRNLVTKLNLKSKSFPEDWHKYSTNMAFSNFCPSNNVGKNVDLSIVYSPTSCIPRSASMNLSLDLFGQSINIFEFGVRTENFESILQRYLGPDRIIGRQVSGVKLDAFLRVFGSEIGMINYRGNGYGQRGNLESRIVDALRGLIDGAKRIDIDVARSLMFLDVSAIFPTVAGFPLRWTASGTTTISLGLEGQLDLPALFMNPLNANTKLKFNPLAVTDISTSMMVDIDVAKSGIKVAATVHSSMAADYSAQFEEGKANIKLDLPKSKMTFIDFKSSVTLVQHAADKLERKESVKIVNEATNTRCSCYNDLSSIIGLRLCATSSVSTPPPSSAIVTKATPDLSPSRLSSFSIVLEKTEPSMTGYMLSISLKRENSMSTSFVVQVNTPGSITDRGFTVKGIVNLDPNMVVKMEAQTPWGKSVTEVELVSRRDVKSVMLKAVIEDEYEFYGKVQTKFNQGDGNYSVVSTLEVGWPEHPPAVILDGVFTHEIGRSYHVSLKPAGPIAHRPIGFEFTAGSEFSQTVQKVWFNNQLLTPFGSALLSTEIGRQDSNYIATFDTKYGTEQKMHSVYLHWEFQEQLREKLYCKAMTVFKLSHFPAMNFDMKLEIGNPDNLDQSYNSFFILVHGPESTHSTNRLFISSYVKLKHDPLAVNEPLFLCVLKTKVTYPRYNINLIADESLLINSKTLKGYPDYSQSSYNYLLQSSNVEIAGIKVDLALFSPPNFLYEISAKVFYHGRTITLVDSGKWLDHNSISVSPVLEFHPGRKIQMIGNATWTATNVLLQMDSVLNDIESAEDQLYSITAHGEQDENSTSLRTEVLVPDMDKIILNLLSARLVCSGERDNIPAVYVEHAFLYEFYQIDKNENSRIEEHTSLKDRVFSNKELSINKNNFRKFSWKTDEFGTINTTTADNPKQHKLSWIVPEWGENVENSFFLDTNSKAFRANLKNVCGPIPVTFDLTLNSTGQDNKVKIDGFIELIAPVIGVPQSKIGFGYSQDIVSISNFDVSGQLNLEYENTNTFSLDTQLKNSPSARNARFSLQNPSLEIDI